MVPLCVSPLTIEGATGTWATVTVTVALALPADAVNCAGPFATAKTRPVGLTVTTPAPRVAQFTIAPLIATPFWSSTSAVSCCVAPIASSVMAAAESWIVVARGGAVESPQDTRRSVPRMATAKRGDRSAECMDSGWLV